MDPNVVVDRLVRLMRLDATVFDEVRDDEREILPAAIIVAVGALLAGFGAFLWWQTIPSSTEGIDGLFLNTVVLGSIFLALIYGVAILVVYLIMVQVFRVHIEIMPLARVLGYAAWPLGLSVLMFIPFVHPVFAILPLCLLFVMMIYAVQSATGAESRDVVVASLGGLAVMVLVLSLIANTTELASAPMGAGLFGILFDLRY